jgi:hypothetical protein
VREGVIQVLPESGSSGQRGQGPGRLAWLPPKIPPARRGNASVSGLDAIPISTHSAIRYVLSVWPMCMEPGSEDRQVGSSLIPSLTLVPHAAQVLVMLRSPRGGLGGLGAVGVLVLSILAALCLTSHGTPPLWNVPDASRNTGCHAATRKHDIRLCTAPDTMAYQYPVQALSGVPPPGEACRCLHERGVGLV